MTALSAAPAKAHARKTRCGRKRSASISKAKMSVPATKPSCTALVRVPTAPGGSCHARSTSGITALTANHSEVPANWESTITGRTRRGTAMLIGPAYPERAGRCRQRRRPRLQHMIPFSVLDLAPITEGSDASQSFRNTLDLAQHA